MENEPDSWIDLAHERGDTPDNELLKYRTKPVRIWTVHSSTMIINKLPGW
jgi:hypothetical protein